MSDLGYISQGYALDGFAATFAGAERPSIKMLTMERGIYDFLASLIYDDLSTRFRTCASRRWKTGRSSSPTCSASSARRTAGSPASTELTPA